MKELLELVMEIKKVKKQQKGFLLPPHRLTNFEMQKYYRNEPRFNGVYQGIICLE